MVDPFDDENFHIEPDANREIRVPVLLPKLINAKYKKELQKRS